MTQSQECLQRIRGLIDGKSKSDNEYVNYSLEKLKESIAESNLLHDQYREIEMRITQIDAAIHKYTEDIMHFDKECSHVDSKTEEKGTL